MDLFGIFQVAKAETDSDCLDLKLIEDSATILSRYLQFAVGDTDEKIKFSDYDNSFCFLSDS